MKFFRYLPIFLMVAFPFRSYAQYDNLIHKTYNQRSPVLFSFYIDTLVNVHTDASAGIQKMNALEKVAQKAGDEDLLLELILMKAHNDYHHQLRPVRQVITTLDSLNSVARKKKKYWLVARIESLESFIYFDKGYNYELSFLHYKKLEEVIQRLTVEDFPEKQACYYQISLAYYYFGDYRNTIRYGKEALKYTPSAPYARYVVQTTNNLGLSFQQLQQYDTANYYFQMAYETETDSSSKQIWYGISRGNIGYSYFLQQDYAKAKPLLREDAKIALEYQDWGLAAGALTCLGTIALDEGQKEEAGRYLQEALKYTQTSHQYHRYEALYPQLARLAWLQGDALMAKTYTDSAFAVKDSLARRFNALQITHALQKADYEKYQNSLQKLENEKQQKINQRNLLIAGLIIVLLTILWFLRELRTKVKDKHRALKNAEQQLQYFLKRISENNALIESLQSQVDGKNEDIIARLQQSTILNEDEWLIFRAAFERLNPGFLTRLKEKMPDLSPAEIRFVVLTKLKFNPKEMAATLGVGQEAVRQYRLRFRKKMSLETDVSIDQIVEKI
ncbi:MAG: hypothetical protein M9887_00620 [Chitinophagales bacterium]|nr:hypothetical protein [Chitinophagales bacterium]